MSILNLTKKYVIDSQIYVSLMGTCLAAYFMLEQNIFRWPTLLLIFITYFSGYLYTKYQYDKKIFFKILIFNCICGIISVILILRNHNEIRLLKWAIIVILGLLYNSFFGKIYTQNSFAKGFLCWINLGFNQFLAHSSGI
jgi:Ca2+/Na+ antiporter